MEKNRSRRIVLKMQEEKGTGWPELLQKQGLHQVADILDRYGIGSATDVSELKDHDFSSRFS